MDDWQDANELEQVNEFSNEPEMEMLENLETITEPSNAAEAALDAHDITAEHPLYARRYASEAAARVTVGSDAVDLDTFSKEHELGLKGGNYPTYDISSSQEIASVKTHWNVEGKLDENALNSYRRDFNSIYGWGREFDALENDANNILSVRDAGGPVPAELKNASSKDAERYLSNQATLRIPDDHVEEVRDVIKKDILSSPQSYNLPDFPTQKEVDEVLQRIKGIGLTSSELKDMIEHRSHH